MPLLFVYVQDIPNLIEEQRIALLQPLGQVFMDRGFGNAKMPCCGTDSGIGLDHVHSQFTGALVQVVFHSAPLHAVCGWKSL
jgi:hypothetical protein